MTPAAKRRIKQDKIRRCQRGTGKGVWRVKFLRKCGERPLRSVLPRLGRGVARGANRSPEAVRGGPPRAPRPRPRPPHLPTLSRLSGMPPPAPRAPGTRAGRQDATGAGRRAPGTDADAERRARPRAVWPLWP